MGKTVAVFDPDPLTEKRVGQAVRAAWPVLTKLGLAEHGDRENLGFCADARAAVEGAEFVQESVPERLGLTHDVFAPIEPALDAEAVVASSAPD